MTPTLNDILKLAKLIALNQGDQDISLLTVRQALSAYVDTSQLDDAAAAHFGLDAKGRKTPDHADGLALLAQYRSTPRLPLQPEVIALSPVFGTRAIAGLEIPPYHHAPGAETQDTGTNAAIAITFQDCLKLAKQLALARSLDTIGLEVLSDAIAMYVDTLDLDRAHAQMLGITPAAPARSDGAAVLASFRNTPRLPISPGLSKLRQRLEGLALKLSLPDGNSAAEHAPGANRDAVPAPTPTPPLTAGPVPAEAKTEAGMENAAPAAHVPAEPAAPPPASPVASALARTEKRIERLGQTVIGQAAVLSRLRIELLASKLGLGTPGKPRTLVCIGPSGTGKTLLAHALSDTHDGGGLILNMSSFQSHNENFGLTGLREGYNNAGPGRLTSFVRKHPQSVIVFDDVDRAHPNTQDILANLLSDGYLEDEYGFGSAQERAQPENRRVSFASTLLVFILRPGLALSEDGSLSALIRQDPARACSLLAEDMLAQRAEAANNDTPAATNAGLTAYLAKYLTTATILPFAELEIDALVGIARNALAAFAEIFSRQAMPVAFDDLELTARAVALSFGPDIAPLEVAEAGTKWLNDACFRDIHGSSGLPASVRVSLTADAAAWLGSRDLQALHRNQFRRREVLRYQLQTRRENEQLVLELGQIRMERIEARRDYGSDGGFAIEIPQLRFSDIKGHALAKERLQQIARLLQTSPEDRAAAPWKDIPPKGVLLHGRPGTGKTMLAKALAAETGLPFIAVAGPQLFSPAFTRSIFARARRYAPSIVFIDEIDALGVRGQRGMDAAINQLLAEIDGFASHASQPVFIVAATNFIANVDPALLRSGRLDLHLEIPLLDREARRHFIEGRLCSLPHAQPPAAESWNIEALLALTAGMSGADFEKVYRELLLSLQQTAGNLVSYEQLLEQINTVKYGERRRHPPLSDYLAAVAYHEAGHAVLAHLLNPDRPLEQVTIAGRGDANGFVAFSRDNEHSRPMNRQDAMNRLCIQLAGRVAQLRQFPACQLSGGSDNGAASDLAGAAELAWFAITHWGLDEEFGWLSLAPFTAPLPTRWQERAQARVDAWIEEARTRTEELVSAYWPAIARLAKTLMDAETLDGSAIIAVIGQEKPEAAQHG